MSLETQFEKNLFYEKYKQMRPESRNTDPYLHVEPSYLNIAKCLRIFGSVFKEFYMARTVKEQTELAQIFNNHLLVTYVMDAFRDRNISTLGETLVNPNVADLFFSIETLKGSKNFSEANERIARNMLISPWANRRPVYIQYETYNFLSSLEREQFTKTQNLAIACQIDVVKNHYIIAAPLFMGTLTFDHFRNNEDSLTLSEFAPLWFETLPFDIMEFQVGVKIPSPEAKTIKAAMVQEGTKKVYTKMLSLLTKTNGSTCKFICADIACVEANLFGKRSKTAILNVNLDAEKTLTMSTLNQAENALIRLAQTGADLLIIQHSGPIEVEINKTLKTIATPPHNPRRFCLIDGNFSWKILNGAGLL